MRERLEGIGRISPLSVFASVAGIGAFALGQPLLDLLGRNPEFFVARRFPSLDIFLLAVLLVLAPVLLALIVLGVRRLNRLAGGLTHLLVLAVLMAVATASVLVASGGAGWPAPVFGAAAAVAGAVLAGLYALVPVVRTGLDFLGLAPAIVAGWFLVATPAADVVFAARPDVPESVRIGDPYPVVMVVFDEFPLTSLMLGDGSLDAEHFPSFARLAADGVWYRNAVGVRQQTEEAVPAILTGREIDESTIPIAAHHPYTLFSLLSATYDVEAVETVTELCPEEVCGNVSRPVDPPGRRWSSIAGDLSVVYGHIVLPEDLSDGLPPIDFGWGGFVQAGPETEEFDIIDRFLDQVADDRRRDLTRFLSTFDGRHEEPLLRFGHFLYPHHPWDLTGDGRVHGAPRPPGRDSVGWGTDAFLVAQGWQRHLIQAQWADTMLGSVLDRLEEEEIYDEAMIVVVADHGITIRPGVEHQRTVTEETTGTIAFVPLFVKYPGDMEGPAPGTIDDDRAETTDILPTIADVVDVPIPWQTVGVSLLDAESRKARQESVMVGTSGPISIPVDTDAVDEVLAEKETWFPGGDPFALVPPGWDGLLGQAVDGDDRQDVAVVVDQAEAVAGYRPGSEPIPAYLSGSVTVEAGATGDEIVAIAIDGEVVAVTRTFQPEGQSARWEAMVDPSLLDASPRAVEGWLVMGSSTNPAFAR